MKTLYIGVAIAVSLLIVGASFLFYPSGTEAEPPKPPAPVAVRYLPTAQLMRELSPIATRFPGEALGLTGFVCHVSVSTSLERVVIVCK